MRPPLEREKDQFACVSLSPTSPEITVGGGKSWRFDNLFGQESTQQEVYDACVRPLLSSFLLGVNACLFCYGALFSLRDLGWRSIARWAQRWGGVNTSHNVWEIRVRY